MNEVRSTAWSEHSDRKRALISEIRRREPRDGARLLSEQSALLAAQVLQELNPGLVSDILERLSEDFGARVLAAAPSEVARQWARNQSYPEGAIGRMMEPAVAVFPPGLTVEQTLARLRGVIRTAFVTYCYVVDGASRLLGLVTMRDLLFARPSDRLEAIMLRDPFALSPDTRLDAAMRQALNRHYPVYPVCDERGRLVGLVRGQVLFEEQTFEISAQPAAMVGVEEERLATSWARSFKFRHPWLQLNLLTAFLAAAVVGLFQDTLDQLVILALFLPVLAGQSGNTGCQSLAVTLRGLTLGELGKGKERALIFKEASLGFTNGALVGVVAAMGMYATAVSQNNPAALLLGAATLLAMIASCVVSGVSGAVIPLMLKRLGFDPASASSIFLTTATDIASMGCFLGLATLLIL
ncbi:MAG TPA: magnesium transporter [Burkholderiales bacterium]|jgi:magnesium transporter|nr:magnesium transporter [Burkholderiales bacterium]